MRREIYVFEQVNEDELRKEKIEIEICSRSIPDETVCTLYIRNENEDANKAYKKANKEW
jgi:hypothetical protein